MRPIANLNNIDARPYAWHGWKWQTTNIASARDGSLEPAVRPYLSGQATTPVKNGAENGFYDIERCILEKVATLMGLTPSHYPTAVELIFAVIKTALHPISDEAALNLMHGRWIAFLRKQRAYEEIMKVDEATDFLHFDDVKEFNKLKEEAQSNHAAGTEFQRALRNTIHDHYNKIKAGAGRQAAALKAYTGPKELAAFDHADQKLVKQFLPPLAFCWRTRSFNSWVGQYRHWPMRVAKDSAHGGEQGAICEILRHTWHDYLFAHGIADANCPIKNLFVLPG